jgi:C4-dicarboxylate-specific signal transduction histidine kinase
MADAAVLAIALAATCAAAFLSSHGGGWHQALPFYMPLPVLIWAALRFGSGGASAALTAVAFAAIAGADRATGPFLASTSAESVLKLQVYVLLTALPVLCMAAVDTARHGVVELHHSLLASLHDHVAIIDARGVVLEANDAWSRMALARSGDGQPLHALGVGANYLVACRDAAANGDSVAQRVLAGLSAVLARERTRFETEYEAGDRRTSYVLTMDALERSDGGAVLIRSDVTLRRQAQRQLEAQRRELSHLSRAAVAGQLSGALAHELNQPLAAILGNADAARRLLAREPVDLDELREIVAEIAIEDQRAAAVIRNLRAFYRRDEARKEQLDVSEVIRDVANLAHSEMVYRSVAVAISLDPALPPLPAVRVQLQQVLLNLILNASEAMIGTARADRVISMSARARDGHVHVAVRDSGPGIDPAIADRMFEPFVTTKPGGLGLGLSISRSIVAAHGGRLWAENNPDGGATVHCLLPLDPLKPESGRTREG